jgi:hypothetical protein
MISPFIGGLYRESVGRGRALDCRQGAWDGAASQEALTRTGANRTPPGVAR